MPGDLKRFSLYSFSTWSYKTKEARSGNGAWSDSGGRPPSCRGHAWTAVNDRHTTWRFSQSKKACRSRRRELLTTARITRIHRKVSLLLLWIQTVSLVFNYLSQYESIEPQHMSQIIKCIYKRRDVMASVGKWKLHWWFAAQEVNKAVIYEGNNAQIWIQNEEHLASRCFSPRCVEFLCTIL